MLVLRVEVWPGGGRDRAREIARVGIANTTGLRAEPDYSVVQLDEAGARINARVCGHRRAFGWLPLAARALAGLNGGGTPAVPDGDDMALAPKETS